MLSSSLPSSGNVRAARTTSSIGKHNFCSRQHEQRIPGVHGCRCSDHVRTSVNRPYSRRYACNPSRVGGCQTWDQKGDGVHGPRSSSLPFPPQTTNPRRITRQGCISWMANRNLLAEVKLLCARSVIARLLVFVRHILIHITPRSRIVKGFAAVSSTCYQSQKQ